MDPNKHINEDSGNELENTTLGKLRRENVFLTPEHYFEELPAQVSKAIISANKPWYNYNAVTLKYIAVTVFAVALLLTGGLYVSYRMEVVEKNHHALLYEDVFNSEMTDRIDDNLLYEYYWQEYRDVESGSQSDDEYSQYYYYLLENNIDVTLIINEL